jgi:hypothetical protein
MDHVDMKKPDQLSTHEVLERVLALEVSSWSYLWDQGEVRHIGPMAQDFYAAFGVGVDDRHIHPADGVGVALAAIQALHELVRAQADEIAELRVRLDRISPQPR